MNFTRTLDGQLQLAGQSIHYRHAYTMQTAGNFIAIVIKLTTSMQNGQNYFGSGHPFFWMDIRWNTTAIIRNRDRFIFVNSHDNFITMTGQCFINRVIDYLENHMMQAG